MPRVLITGIAGFIGSFLAHECVARGYEVRGIDNLCTGNLGNIADAVEDIEFYKGNLTDRRLLRRLCTGVEIIFHQAALPSVAASITDPLTSHLANVDGTLNLLLEAKRQGVRRVVYAASSAAYGNSEILPTHESMLPVPISPYAIQKLTGEYYMQCFARIYGVETVSLRYFNVFGPRQSAHSAYSGVLARFITSMLLDKEPEIYGDGTQSRDFTFVDDVVEANLLAASADAAAVSGEVFNIACGERHTLLETYQIIANALHFTRDPKFLPARKGDIQHSLADISRAREYLGYEPRAGFRTGLKRTIEWYQDEMRRSPRTESVGRNKPKEFAAWVRQP
jgi:nucleoside-diphosphate-sugar epimerase